MVLVHEASEAIAAMKGNSHPDLILLSYRLQGLAGPQVSKHTPSCYVHVFRKLLDGKSLDHIHHAISYFLLIEMLCLHQVVRAIRQSHADLPIFALSQTADNAASAIKGDLYGGAVQDWLKLPADASEVIARVEGALRHQVLTHFFDCIAQRLLGYHEFMLELVRLFCAACLDWSCCFVHHFADDVACIRDVTVAWYLCSIRS